MNKTLLVDEEMLDRIIVNELKEAYSLNKTPNKIDCSEDYIDVDTQLLYSLDKVLQYYMAPDEYNSWLLKRNDE